MLWSGLAYFQWVALASACCATFATIALWHQGRWTLGLPARFAARDLCIGAAFATVLIGSADLLIVWFTPLRHARGHGFPTIETFVVFVPAVLHEELVFRGYPYQLLRRFNRIVAIGVSSFVFAALHARNDDVTALALVNVFIGGVILALAYDRYERLWMPIGLHFAWNMLSGPLLGYDVSGFSESRSLLVVVGKGPTVLTGGAFGIEGSIIMTGVECVAVLVLWKWNDAFHSKFKNLNSGFTSA